MALLLWHIMKCNKIMCKFLYAVPKLCLPACPETLERVPLSSLLASRRNVLLPVMCVKPQSCVIGALTAKP
jgi:hypothetical protein